MGRSNTNFGQSPLPMELTFPKIDSRKIPFEVSLLSLSGINGLGRKGLKALVEKFGGDLGAVWGASPDQLRAALAESNIPSAEAISSSIKQNTKARIEEGYRKLELDRRTSGTSPCSSSSSSSRSSSPATGVSMCQAAVVGIAVGVVAG
jgi:hypothetical protein